MHADYRHLFESAPDLYLVLDPDLRIVAATDAYLRATMTTREQVIGCNVFEAFPSNPAEDATAEATLRASLERVRRERIPDAMAVVKYGIRRPGGADDEFETRYWSPINSPVLDARGRLAYILHAVEDVTEYVRQRDDSGDQFARMQAEILRRQAELEAANAQLRAANRAQNDFLSKMSHELRTPLNAILGFAQLLELEQLNAEQQSFVRDILRGGWHLLDLINEILDITRIEAGTLGISLEPVQLGEAVGEALSLVRPLAESCRINLRDEVGALGNRYVLADRQRLKQVLLNLLSNALKYNESGGSVTVRLEDDNGWVRIAVADNGIGIAPELHERVFAPFDRLGAETTTVEGTGLGLALARGLMETMGGTLTLESEPGRGSTFTIELIATVSPSDEMVVGPRPGADTPLPPGRLLLIEDNPANVKLIERILGHDRGVELISAMQGTLGLELAREHAPDLILLDVHLPDMSGRDVLARLREDPATRDVPAVVLSADATDDQVSRMLSFGAQAYVTKPLDIQKFRTVVREILTGGEPG